MTKGISVTPCKDYCNYSTLKVFSVFITIFIFHRLRVFENRVLRRIFGAKRNEVTGEWRKLHNEELRDLYSSPSIIRIIRHKEVPR
jgi:hypothetical protein